MKKVYFLVLFLFAVGLLTAQEQLSKEEKERRMKNIQAGNPFAKLGSNAKVATLSNGKYLEVQDLDSIVTIGTVRFNVERNEIVGYIEKDITNADSQPIGDVPSRWISPDPISEEFPEWSPYTFVYNNPIKFTDPTGMAPEECCPSITGFVVGMVDNIAGTHYRNNITGGKAYDNGVRDADALSLVGGSLLVGKGVADMGAGTTGLAASATVTAASGGLSIEVTGPTAIASTGLIGLGAAETLIGGNIAANAMNNMKDDNSSSSANSSSEVPAKQSKVKKEVKTESIGNGKFTKTTEVRPGNGPGQSRAEYIRYKNQNGKVIKNVKDSYDRANKIQHRKPKELPKP